MKMPEFGWNCNRAWGSDQELSSDQRDITIMNLASVKRRWAGLGWHAEGSVCSEMGVTATVWDEVLSVL